MLLHHVAHPCQIWNYVESVASKSSGRVLSVPAAFPFFSCLTAILTSASEMGAIHINNKEEILANCQPPEYSFFNRFCQDLSLIHI